MLRDHRSFRFQTNVLGLVRSILAISLLLTLLTNSVSDLFFPTGQTNRDLMPESVAQTLSIFSLFGKSGLEWTRAVAVAILCLVVIGWRPRWTAILHWWVSFSFSVSAVLVDGGDQINAVLCLLLLPLCFADGRVWHWQSPSETSFPADNFYASSFLQSVHFILRLQVAAIYFQASTAKFAVDVWSSGTAVYYWFNDPIFGMPEWIRPLLEPIITNSHGVVLLSWSVLVLEVFLAAALFMPSAYAMKLLPWGLAFHLGIALVHSLSSFFLTMSAALIILLRPLSHEFSSSLWDKLKVKNIRLTWRWLAWSDRAGSGLKANRT